MKKLLYAAAALSMMAACTSGKMDAPLLYGEISVALASEQVVDVLTKAAVPLPEDEAHDYEVFIHDSDGNELYKSAYDLFVPQKLAVSEDPYTVSAENCTAVEAETGRGRMRLWGKTEVTLSASDLTPEVTVDCKVVNCLVTVEFDSSVAGRFTDLKVELTGGGRTSAETVLESDGKTDVWFNPSAQTRNTAVSYTITGVFDQTGASVEMTGSRTLEARNHMKLVVKVNLDKGQISNDDLSVTIDKDMVTVDPSEEEFNPYN